MNQKTLDQHRNRELEDRKLESDAKSLGHIYTYTGDTGQNDSFTCSCGWKSRSYWDGSEYALNEWREHVRKIVAENQAQLNPRTP